MCTEDLIAVLEKVIADKVARGAFVRSSARVRNAARQPCGTACVPISRGSLDSVESVSGRPRRVPGKTRSEPVLRMASASASMAGAASDSGTPCACSVFMRWPGMRHSRVFMSISSHVARLASPPRAAVGTGNRKHGFAARVAADPSTAASTAVTPNLAIVGWGAFTEDGAGNAPRFASPAMLRSTYPWAGPGFVPSSGCFIGLFRCSGNVRRGGLAPLRHRLPAAPPGRRRHRAASATGVSPSGSV